MSAKFQLLWTPLHVSWLSAYKLLDQPSPCLHTSFMNGTFYRVRRLTDSLAIWHYLTGWLIEKVLLCWARIIDARCSQSDTFCIITSYRANERRDVSCVPFNATARQVLSRNEYAACTCNFRIYFPRQFPAKISISACNRCSEARSVRVIDADESKVTNEGGGTERTRVLAPPSGNCELIEEHKKRSCLLRSFCHFTI